MKYEFFEKEGVEYVAFLQGERELRTEQDASDLIGACFERGVSRLLLHADALSEDFFRLRTGLAGAVMQKLVNYRIRTAVVVPEDRLVLGKAKEMLAELKFGNAFRSFSNEQEAVQWLTRNGG
ncbi:DUF4180 domain-containing protein [Paenibacillus sp.]|uniref:DUF4180 domain-containing protein n=1 Tax=Paenibacillus sp. TaxID=58172 RepID=UPI002810F2A6|nr:DUF4180 domain-containing protein [Paenibacillus sp.]